MKLILNKGVIASMADQVAQKAANTERLVNPTQEQLILAEKSKRSSVTSARDGVLYLTYVFKDESRLIIGIEIPKEEKIC